MKFRVNGALQGKQYKTTKNKRHKRNLKPQSKILFLALQFFKSYRIGRCFLVESVFLLSKISSWPKKQPTSGNPPPLGLCFWLMAIPPLRVLSFRRLQKCMPRMYICICVCVCIYMYVCTHISCLHLFFNINQ